MKEHSISIKYFECKDSELSIDEQNCIHQAIEAAKKAYAPYSKFSVGAAVLMENGEIISAGNQENAAFPSGMCAERNALFYAKAKYPDTDIICLAIVALTKSGDVQKEPVFPCGSCRQVITESTARNKNNFKLILHGSNKNLVWTNANDLLPFSFGPENL
ncbi:MAG: cytidine deaminase [Bacteroidales bacterium]|nr:cytidine deaminase [Bacteroidales bacterium]